MSTFDRLKKLILDVTSVDESRVTDQASFDDDLYFDSLDNVELVMSIEEEFGIEVPDDEAEKILTVGDAVKFIDKRVSA